MFELVAILQQDKFSKININKNESILFSEHLLPSIFALHTKTKIFWTFRQTQNLCSVEPLPLWNRTVLQHGNRVFPKASLPLAFTTSLRPPSSNEKKVWIGPCSNPNQNGFNFCFLLYVQYNSRVILFLFFLFFVQYNLRVILFLLFNEVQPLITKKSFEKERRKG